MAIATEDVTLESSVQAMLFSRVKCGADLELIEVLARIEKSLLIDRINNLELHWNLILVVCRRAIKMQFFSKIFKADAEQTEPLEAYFDNKAALSNESFKDVDHEDHSGHSDAVRGAYTDEELREKFIVRAEDRRCYIVFDSAAECYEMMTSSAAVGSICWHEVIAAGVSQKLRFDIDFNSSAIDQLVERRDPIVSLLLSDPAMILENLDRLPTSCHSYLRGAFDKSKIDYGGYDQFTSPNNAVNVVGECFVRDFIDFLRFRLPNTYILRCNSYVLGVDEFKKLSVHLILGAFCTNYKATAEWCNKLFHEYIERSSFAAICAQYFVDMAIYKPLQNFRMTGSTKLGARQSRRKVLQNELWDSPYENWYHTCITAIDARYEWQLDNIGLQEVKKVDTTLNVADISNINDLPDNFMKIIEPYAKGLRIASRLGNTVFFRRVQPSHCLVCERTHDNENSLIVTVYDTSYVIKCRRNAAGRKIVIGIKSSIQRRRINREEVAAKEEIVGGRLSKTLVRTNRLDEIRDG